LFCEDRVVVERVAVVEEGEAFSFGGARFAEDGTKARTLLFWMGGVLVVCVDKDASEGVWFTGSLHISA
jgi:hypothetical protein